MARGQAGASAPARSRWDSAPAACAPGPGRDRRGPAPKVQGVSGCASGGGQHQQHGLPGGDALAIDVDLVGQEASVLCIGGSMRSVSATSSRAASGVGARRRRRRPAPAHCRAGPRRLRRTGTAARPGWRPAGPCRCRPGRSPAAAGAALRRPGVCSQSARLQALGGAVGAVDARGVGVAGSAAIKSAMSAAHVPRPAAGP